MNLREDLDKIIKYLDTVYSYQNYYFLYNGIAGAMMYNYYLGKYLGEDRFTNKANDLFNEPPGICVFSHASVGFLSGRGTGIFKSYRVLYSLPYFFGPYGGRFFIAGLCGLSVKDRIRAHARSTMAQSADGSMSAPAVRPSSHPQTPATARSARRHPPSRCE